MVPQEVYVVCSSLPRATKFSCPNQNPQDVPKGRPLDLEDNVRSPLPKMPVLAAKEQ